LVCHSWLKSHSWCFPLATLLCMAMADANRQPIFDRSSPAPDVSLHCNLFMLERIPQLGKISSPPICTTVSSLTVQDVLWFSTEPRGERWTVKGYVGSPEA
jgi:hypothetical protein